MKNVTMTVEKNVLTIKVDLTKTFGSSKSGKSIVVGSTEGNQHVEGEVYCGVNVYKKI